MDFQIKSSKTGERLIKVFCIYQQPLGTETKEEQADYPEKASG